MGTIYRKAKWTLVSLGPHADDSKFLIDCMQELLLYTSDAAEQRDGLEALASNRHRTDPEHAGGNVAPLPPQHDGQDSTPAGALTSYSETFFWEKPEDEKRKKVQWLRWLDGKSQKEFQRLMEAWEAFVGRPYWQRLWVLQELILSKNRQRILCGDTLVPYSFLAWFQSAWRTFQNKDMLSVRLGVADSLQHPSPFNGLTLMMNYLSNPTIQVDNGEPRILLYGIYGTLSHLLCQDPRDRICGVQEVVEWPPGPAVEISYRKTPFALMREILAQWCAATTTTCYSISSLFETLQLGRPENNDEMREYLNTLLSSTEVDVQIETCDHEFTHLGGKSLVGNDIRLCADYSWAYLRETDEGVLTMKADQIPFECPWSLDSLTECVRQVKKGPVVIALVPANTKEGDVLLRPDGGSLLGFVGRHSRDDVLEIVGGCVISTDHTTGHAEDVTSVQSVQSIPSRFELCLDGDDQLRLMLAIYLHTDSPNYRFDSDLLSEEALSFIAQGRFKGSRFSSYAIEYGAHVDEWERESTRVCRRCGTAQYFGT